MRNPITEQMVKVALELDNRFSRLDAYNVIQFTQVWGSTALGFDDIGGSMMTNALTTVVMKEDKRAEVWFNIRKAYEVNINDNFMQDLAKHSMASRADARERYSIVP